MHLLPQILFQRNHVRQDSAVKQELHVLGGGGLHGVLPDDREQVRLVREVGRPESIHILPGRGQVFTFCEDMLEGAWGGVGSASRQVTGARLVS